MTDSPAPATPQPTTQPPASVVPPPPTSPAPASAPPPVVGACPSCGAAVWPDDNFCESCRAELSPALFSGASPDLPGQCPTCPEAAITPEGYCESCGRMVPAGSDHSELELDLVAGVTDRGLRHPRNEDAMALATARTPDGQPVAIAVVCDGVSTSSRPDEASHKATRAAMGVLLPAVRMSADLTVASADAFTAALDALVTMAAEGRLAMNAPSATFISAVVTGRDVTICWLGDSRAYWLDARSTTEARQLSRDDSVAQELVARGLLSEPDAMASPAGHVVTGWIGADLRDAKPHVTTYTPDGPGAVLLCSDGLWNYQPEAAELAKIALPAALTDPLGAAAALVEFALGAGGGDNVTVVLAPFPASDRPDIQAATTPDTVPRAVLLASTVQAPILQALTVQAPIVQALTVQGATVQAATIQAPTVQAPTVQAAVPQAAVPQAAVPQAAVPQAASPQTEENPADEPG